MELSHERTHAFTGDLQLTISRTPANPEKTTATDDYRYEFSCHDSTGQTTTLSLLSADTAEQLRTPLNRGGRDASHLQMRVPEGAGLSRVRIRISDRFVALVLPDPTITTTIEEILQGNRMNVQELLDSMDSVSELVFACGQFLSVEQVVTVLQAVVSTDRYAASQLHSARYAIIRGALTVPLGFTLETATQLETLIEGLDSITEIGSVDVLPALADAIATVSQTPDETEQLLKSLGYELADLEQRDDFLLFACHLAQLVCFEGLYAAEGHAMQRRYQMIGQYVRRKTDAKKAAFENRGRAWRRLICTAVRQHAPDEFAYVLANALYWTGRTSMTDSWMETLLFDAAGKIADKLEIDYLARHARYHYAVTAGHAHRSSNNYRLALTQFERAKAIALTTDSLPEWKPLYNAAVVDADAALEAGNPERGVQLLSNAIEDLLTYDIPTEQCNEIVHHLAGQKQEARAMAAGSRDGTDRVTALSEAKSHYDASGLSRSRDRAARKLANATREQTATQDAPPDAGQAADSSAQTDTGHSLGSSDQSDQSASQTASATSSQSPQRTAEPRSEQIHEYPQTEINGTEKDALVEPPELQDQLTQPDEDAVGGSDLMTSPDDRNPPNDYWNPDDFDDKTDTNQ